MLNSCPSLLNRYSGWSCALLVLGLLAGGCGREDVKVYRVSKDAPADSAPAESVPPGQGGMPPGHPDVGASSPALVWKTPAGWQETTPGEMRVASFSLKGENGQKADVSIIPLGGVAGGDFANVNRWRGQVGAAPLAEGDLASQGQKVEMGGQPADLYDIAGKNPDGSGPMRILGVIQHREATAWFVKMTGDDALVAQQKPAFVEFLRSLQFRAADAAGLPPAHPPLGDMNMRSPAAADASGGAQPDWQAPPGWQSVAAGQFLVAKFAISGSGGAQAAVNVSASAGDGGGLLNNVNRWRKQLGLDALSAADLKTAIAALDVAGGQASLVEFSGTDARTGQPARLVAAIVPQGNQTWFYKLMGDDAVVAREKTAFTNFVQTVKY